MDRHEWVTLFPRQDFDVEWDEIAVAKPSLAERFATRIFRNRRYHGPWFIALVCPLCVLYGLIQESRRLGIELGWSFTILLAILLLQAPLTAWITQGFCALLLRVWAQTRPGHGAPS